jgi:hypothetical protein
MKTQNSNSLLARMATREPAAFRDFDRWYRSRIYGWCMDCGLTPKQAAMETPRCLFELCLMIMQRHQEIDGDDALEIWLHCETRNLVVDYWRKQGELTSQRAGVFALSITTRPLTCAAARELTSFLDGRRRSYRLAARRYGLPIRWLRRQHRRMIYRVRRQWLAA